MSRSWDLTDFFREWEYDEENNVRFITTEGGREIMQIRQPLGIEQYDLDGRPDGVRPNGHPSALDLYQERETRADSTGAALVLEGGDFEVLQAEGVLFYQRYLALFQVGDYDRVARDTAHNLTICELLERRFSSNRRFEILQYRPYIRRMNAISRAMVKLAADETHQAMEELESGRADIESYPAVPTPIFEFEKIRSLQHLSQVISQVRDDTDLHSGPKGFKDRLTEELRKAVENEEYEKAARLRDRLQGLD